MLIRLDILLGETMAAGDEAGSTCSGGGGGGGSEPLATNFVHQAFSKYI